MTTTSKRFYDFDTLHAACRTPVLYVWDGIAAAEDFVARANPVLRFGRDKNGQQAQHDYDIDFALLEIQHNRLRRFQNYVQQNPTALDASLRPAGSTHIVATPNVPGFVLSFIPLRETVHFRGKHAHIGIDYRQAEKLISGGDKLLAVYLPGNGTWLLVVRDGTVMAAIDGLVAVEDEPVSPPDKAVELGLLPQV